MKKEQLRKMATEAIERWNSSPFKLSQEPIVQFWQTAKLPSDFPIPAEYLGKRKGRHVYNLSAKAVLQYIDRHDLES